MAWDVVIDVNDGQDFDGDAWQSAIDAIEQLQASIGPDVPTTTFAALETQVNPAPLSLNDDQAAYLSFTGSSVIGVICIGPNVSSAGSALASFRTSDGAAFVAVIGSGGVTVGTFTVHLTGTTGADGQLNLSGFSHATERRFYIENRTGGARSYGVSLLSLRPGGANAVANDGTWTIV